MSGGGLLAAAGLLVAVGLCGAGCDGIGESIDNFDSRVVCGDYCSKKFDCESHDATSGEHDACVSSCRDAIENQCGNEHQAAANDRIAECVDKGCGEFWVCMVFEAAPGCFGFVGE